MKEIISKIKSCFGGNKSDESNIDCDEEAVKISGTKEYVDIEYKGQIARFGGSLCLHGFAATASSMSWVHHVGALNEGEQMEIMRAAHRYTKYRKFKVYFYDDEDNEITF